MAINFDNVAKRIFQILKSRGFHLKMYQEDGEVAYDPEKEARKFYIEDEGIMVSINETGERSEVKVYISDESDIQKLKTMLQSLRQTASFFGLNYNLRKYGKKLTPKEFSFLAYKSKKNEEEMNETTKNPAAKSLSQFKPKKTKTKQETKKRKDRWDRKAKHRDKEMKETIEVFEAKDISNLWGSKKSSYQKVGEGRARMVVRHAKPVDENKFAARTRNIQKIFIENTEGERIKFPVNWLQGARAMTRHISEGGTWDDDIGIYIRNMAEEFRNLKRFTKHTHRDLNEDATEVVGIVRNRTKQIAQEMKKLQGPMSYRRFVESFEPGPEILLGEDNLSVEVNRLRSMFDITEEWDGVDESFNSVALITSNSNRVDELRDESPIEQQVQKLLSKGEIKFLPKENHIEMPKDRKERVATLLGDLASRVKNDEVSVFLSRLVDQIVAGETPSKEDMALATEVVKASKVSESISRDENKDIGMFVEWASQFNPLTILLKENEKYNKEKKIKKRNKAEKKKVKQNKESVVYVHPHRQEHYKDGKQVRITDPSKVGRLAEAAKKGGANYAKAKAGGFYKDDVSAFDSLDTSDEAKLRRSLEAKGVPSHRIEQAIAAHKKRKGVSEKVNESEIIRLAELAGVKKRFEVAEIEADPYGGSMISPYTDEPNDADYERSYDIMLDFIEEEIRKQGVTDLEDFREVLPDIVSDVYGRLEADGLGYFEKSVIKNAAIKKASAMGFDTNEDIGVQFDDEELKHDIVTKPGIRQKFKRDPKNIMNKYRKKQ